MDPCKSGEYGFIFHPSIIVNHGIIHEDESEQYITKIQKDHNETACEIEIGNKIKTIPLHEHFFAPIISSEQVYISPTTEFTQKIREKNKPKDNMYISNKIRYVGKDTIDNHLSRERYSLKKILNTHLHLIEAIGKLQTNNIIHMDLKCNNIMWDDVQNVPIIIDFGLSRMIDIQNFQLDKDFFISYENYEYWCIDIYIVSQIIHNQYLSLHDLINTQSLKQMYNDFLNNAHTELLGKHELRKMEIEYTNYFAKYTNQTWGNLVNQLLKCYTSWDNYALSIVYLYIIKYAVNKNNCENKKRTEHEELLRGYQTLLQETMMSTPEKRQSSKKTRNELLHLFS